MSSIFLYRRTSCRLCESFNLESVFKLADSPPAEWFFQPNHSKSSLIKYPLELFFCLNCFHVQLLDVLSPESLFCEYFYTSQSSPGLQMHFKKFANKIVADLNLNSQDLAVDIGSNDGTLLKDFKFHNVRVAGIEPSLDLAAMCESEGIPVSKNFLNKESVDEILKQFGPARLVTANNVFAHNDDLFTMLLNIKTLLASNGIFVFEVSSLYEMIKCKVFDWIYHEHLSYHSLISLIPFLKKAGLEIRKVEYILTKGGSMRVYATHRGSLETLHDEDSIEKQVNLELSYGLNKSETFKKFAAEINNRGKILRNELTRIKKNRRTIVGFGASATTTTLLFHFELLPFLEFLVDDNPIRWGTLVPGTNLMVKKPTELEKLHNFDVLITAWRFESTIRNQYSKKIKMRGGRFLVPLPEFNIFN